MNSVIETFLLGVLPFFIFGSIFFVIGFIAKRHFSTQLDLYRTSGELIGFRESIVFNDEDYRGPAETKDYDYNKKNSKPLFKFSEGSRSVIIPSEFSTNELNKQDIGKKIPIVCFKRKKKGGIKVMIDNAEQKKQFKRGSLGVFWSLGGAGIVCFMLGLYMANNWVKIYELF